MSRASIGGWVGWCLLAAVACTPPRTGPADDAGSSEGGGGGKPSGAAGITGGRGGGGPGVPSGAAGAPNTGAGEGGRAAAAGGSGGTTATGGAPGSGAAGAMGVGGALAGSGGGGTGGAHETGGAQATGGVQGNGAVPGSGGARGTGGGPGTAGAAGSGGANDDLGTWQPEPPNTPAPNWYCSAKLVNASGTFAAQACVIVTGQAYQAATIAYNLTTNLAGATATALVREVGPRYRCTGSGVAAKSFSVCFGGTKNDASSHAQLSAEGTLDDGGSVLQIDSPVVKP